MSFRALFTLIHLGRIWSFIPVYRGNNQVRLKSLNQDEDTNCASSVVELWLDLRQSSIPPKAALMYLSNDLWDEYTVPDHKTFLVDKVVMNDKSDLSSAIRDVNEEFEDKIGMIVSDNDQIYEVQQESMTRISIGRVFPVIEKEKGIVNINENPLPILDKIADGKWSIIDEEAQGTENTKSAIRSIVELASNSLGGYSASSSSIGGGIAVSCNSDGDILNMCALVVSLGGTFSETDSGILVKTENSTSPKTNKLQYAILIPFEACLWKTASFVFQ
jgi:hypothetical protein